MISIWVLYSYFEKLNKNQVKSKELCTEKPKSADKNKELIQEKSKELCIEKPKPADKNDEPIIIPDNSNVNAKLNKSTGKRKKISPVKKRELTQKKKKPNTKSPTKRNTEKSANSSVDDAIEIEDGEIIEGIV